MRILAPFIRRSGNKEGGAACAVSLGNPLAPLGLHFVFCYVSGFRVAPYFYTFIKINPQVRKISIFKTIKLYVLI